MSGAGIAFNWAVKYLYDGECAMCLTLKAVLERNDRERRIRFVDIADVDYDPMANMGVVRAPCVLACALRATASTDRLLLAD